MDADPRLAAHRRVWQKKPALRKIYADYYRRITCHCTNGQTLEIGAGSGHIREHMDQVFMADILPAEWLDVAADAQQLPFGDESLSNIVMVDVLHHIERPTALFDEVTRVLRPGGKMVMLDPAITIGSWPIYKFLHSEPVNIRVDPLYEECSQSGGDPFDPIRRCRPCCFLVRIGIRNLRHDFLHLGLWHGNFSALPPIL